MATKFKFNPLSENLELVRSEYIPDTGITTLFSGENLPIAEQGIDNDHFLNSKTGATYKKVAGSWVLKFVVNVPLAVTGIVPEVKTVLDTVDMPGFARSAKYIVNLSDSMNDYFVALEIHVVIVHGDVEWTVSGMVGDVDFIPHDYMFEISEGNIVMSIMSHHSENLTFNASRTVALV